MARDPIIATQPTELQPTSTFESRARPISPSLLRLPTFTSVLKRDEVDMALFKRKNQRVNKGEVTEDEEPGTKLDKFMRRPGK